MLLQTLRVNNFRVKNLLDIEVQNGIVTFQVLHFIHFLYYLPISDVKLISLYVLFLDEKSRIKDHYFKMKNNSMGITKMVFLAIL